MNRTERNKKAREADKKVRAKRNEARDRWANRERMCPFERDSLMYLASCRPWVGMYLVK